MLVKISSIFLLFFVSSGLFAQEVLPLYKDSIPDSKGSISQEDVPTLTIYLPAKEKSLRAAVLVIPGGGYGFLATSTEGTPIAQAFVQRGVAAFVLKYRLPSDQTMRDKSFGPLMDAQQALKTIRENCHQWNIDSNKVGVIGFSAGGHLAATLGTKFHHAYISNLLNTNLRPDFMILVYPVISMKSELTHQGSRNNLLGTDALPAKTILFSAEDQVLPTTPPTYLTHTGDDEVVKVDNSIEMYKSLVRNRIDAELHLYPKGGHGFIQMWSVDLWLDPVFQFLRREKVLFQDIH